MRIIKELHILVGLPGSGKTTFAKQYEPTYLDPYSGNRRPNPKTKKPAFIVDYDELYRKAGRACNLDIVNKVPIANIKYEYMILDGLFITQSDVECVIGAYLNNPKFTEKYAVEKIIIDVWKPDKDACIWNDELPPLIRLRQIRRGFRSSFTLTVTGFSKP